jgi:hypothetical protein
MSPLCRAPAFRRITDEQLLSAGPRIAVLATRALAAPAIRGVMDYTSLWCPSSVMKAGATLGSRDGKTAQACCNIPICLHQRLLNDRKQSLTIDLADVQQRMTALAHLVKDATALGRLKRWS